MPKKAKPKGPLAHYRNPLNKQVILIACLLVIATILVWLLITQASIRLVIVFSLFVCLLGLAITSIEVWHKPYLISLYEDGLFVERYAGTLMIPWHAVKGILVHKIRRDAPQTCHLSIQFEDQHEQVVVFQNLKQNPATSNDPSDQPLSFYDLIDKISQRTGL